VADYILLAANILT